MAGTIITVGIVDGIIVVIGDGIAIAIGVGITTAIGAGITGTGTVTGERRSFAMAFKQARMAGLFSVHAAEIRC